MPTKAERLQALAALLRTAKFVCDSLARENIGREDVIEDVRRRCHENELAINKEADYAHTDALFEELG